MRRAIARIEESLAGKAHQVAVPGLVLCEQNQRAMMSRARTGARRLVGGLRKGDGQRASEDWLHTFGSERFGKFKRAEKVVPVGDGERGLSVGGGQLRKSLHRQRAFQQRIGGMHMKVDEAWLRHRLPRVHFKPTHKIACLMAIRQGWRSSYPIAFAELPPSQPFLELNWILGKYCRDLL